MEDHLDECAKCSERLRWLAPAVNVLPATVAQQAPPPELRARLLEIVEREAGADETTAARAGPASPRRRLRLPGFDGFSLRPALAGLAVVLLVAAGIAGYAVRDGSTATDTRTYAAAGSGKGSQAFGTLEVNGDQGSLSVSNLPATRPGEVYQAWVQDVGPEGQIHPSSVFVVSDDGSGNVAIPEGLEGAEQVMVTREPAGGSDQPHESSLVTAKIE